MQLGKGLYTIQDGLCGSLVNSLDALWLSYAIIAFFAAISMPALIWSANVIWAYTYVQISPDNADDKKNGKGRDNGYKVMATNEDEEESPRRRQGEVVVTIR